VTSRFQEQLLTDLDEVFLNAGDFAQPVTLFPAGGGDPVSLTAIVDFVAEGVPARDYFTARQYFPRETWIKSNGTMIRIILPQAAVSRFAVGDRLTVDSLPGRTFVFQLQDGGDLAANSTVWTDATIAERGAGVNRHT